MDEVLWDLSSEQAIQMPDQLLNNLFLIIELPNEVGLGIELRKMEKFLYLLFLSTEEREGVYAATYRDSEVWVGETEEGVDERNGLDAERESTACKER